MHKIVDTMLVLKRVDYGESDRIVTVLSSSGGKFSLLAKGVRKPKSKLAGGIEPFCINSVTYLQSPRELKTLVSATATQQLSGITGNIDTLNTGYLLLRTIHVFTEHECEDVYYSLTEQSLLGLNNRIDRQVVYVWFMVQLLYVSGHAINTNTDDKGQDLQQKDTFRFDMQAMAFTADPYGVFTANHIKLLRVVPVMTLQQFALVQNVQQLAGDLSGLLADIASNIMQTNLK